MKKIAFTRTHKGKTAGSKPALWLTPLLLGLSLLGSSLPVYSQNAESDVRYVWAKQAGGQSSSGTGIAADTSGNSYIAGSFEKTVTFGTTTLTSASAGGDAFIARLDATGNFLWAKQSKVSNNNGCTVEEIALDAAGNSYITGLFSGTVTLGSIKLTSNSGGAYNDIFIAKLDTNGNFLWSKQVVGRSKNSNIAFFPRIAVDAAGNCYVTGAIHETVTFGSSTLTGNSFGLPFITKLDPDGNFLWANMVTSGTPGIESKGIAVDTSGNCYITGNTPEGASFGSITIPGNTEGNIFIAKLDATGNFLWVKQAGEGVGNDADDSYGIGVDASGNSYVTGSMRGTALFGTTRLTETSTESRVFLTKLDANGNFLWAEKAGGELVVSVLVHKLISVDASGNCYMTGMSTAARNDTTIVFGDTKLAFEEPTQIIVKLDANGDLLWMKKGTVGNIAADNTGNCYVTGTINKSATFDSITLVYDDGALFICKLSEQQEDGGVGIAKYSPAGSIILLPNPFRQNIHLQIDLQKAASAVVSVYDLTGRQVYRLESQKLAEGKNTITLSPAFENVPTGIYLVNVLLDNGEKWIRKVVKME